MHPQKIEEAKITERENLLWWEMDKIAVEYSNRIPKSTQKARLLKANAAENMMRFLQKPTHEWCRAKYEQEQRA